MSPFVSAPAASPPPYPGKEADRELFQLGSAQLCACRDDGPKKRRHVGERRDSLCIHPAKGNTPYILPVIHQQAFPFDPGREEGQGPRPERPLGRRATFVSSYASRVKSLCSLTKTTPGCSFDSSWGEMALPLCGGLDGILLVHTVLLFDSYSHRSGRLAYRSDN